MSETLTDIYNKAFYYYFSHLLFSWYSSTSLVHLFYFLFPNFPTWHDIGPKEMPTNAVENDNIADSQEIIPIGMYIYKSEAAEAR